MAVLVASERRMHPEREFLGPASEVVAEATQAQKPFATQVLQPSVNAAAAARGARYTCLASHSFPMEGVSRSLRYRHLAPAASTAAGLASLESREAAAAQEFHTQTLAWSRHTMKEFRRRRAS